MFRVPTRVRIAPGCSAELGRITASLGATRALFVTDAGLAASALVDRAIESLTAAGVGCERFSEVEPNPRTTTAERAATLGREARCDLVIGFGGGSSLDCAKAAAMLATNGGRATAYAGPDRFDRAPLPFVAVPTTCGTGSEVTWVAVLTDVERSTKISVKGERMFPAVALVDSDLIATLPAALVASTGMDALTHALESTTCKQANPVADALAEKSIALTFEYLPRAVADVGGDAKAREAVMRASTIAGLSFGNSDVAGVHCLSETIGGLFDVPHGLCNAMLLGPVLRSHLAQIEPRLTELDAVLGATSPSAAGFFERLDALLEAVEIPAFRELGVDPGAFPKIAAGSVANGSNGSNPRPMAEADYLAILTQLVS